MTRVLNYCGSAAILLLISSFSIAQSSSDWEVARTIDGHPDLQGVWENNTMTPVERPEVFGDKEMLTDDDVEFLQQRMAQIMAEGGDALFGEGVLAAAFSGEINSYDPTTGNYDSQWMVDRKIHRRTSQIIDPPNGQYPPRTEQAVAAAPALGSAQTRPPRRFLYRPTSR